MTHTVRSNRFVHPARFVVLIVAKAPIPGHAKTRLCPPARHEQAARIAAASLLDTLATVRSIPEAQPVVALSGDPSRACHGAELVAELADLPVIEQGSGGLAARLADALGQVSGLFPGLGVLLIGMDTPQVRAEALVSTAETMYEPDIDAVLGPASDGGWWLLGLHTPGDPHALDALRETPMSMPDTGDRTLRALKGMGANVAMVSEVSDVDTMEDAWTVAATIPASGFARAVDSVAVT